jgi:hypothetical protein
MKKFLTQKMVAVMWLALTFLNASGQAITTPRDASPAATVSQTIGISTVTVNYSRPSVRGREVWGNLVPYGWTAQGFGNGNEAPWRAGANENTVITFSHAATVEGKLVPPGSYGFFLVINQDNTGEVVLSKDYRSWGSYFYEAGQDQLRSKIQVRTIPNTEMLTCEFINVTKNSAELVLNWEKKQFPVKVEFAVTDIVMANAEQELKGPTGFTWQGYSSAANYALQNNINLDKALTWIDNAIAQNSNFTTLRIKSGILKQTGKTAEADKMMKEALAVGTEAELNTYGYQLINQGEHDKAIEILALNTTRHPKSANAWDSLGEAYATKGDKTNAIKNFKKSLNLNPPANVKANSEKFLRQLGAL